MGVTEWDFRGGIARMPTDRKPIDLGDLLLSLSTRYRVGASLGDLFDWLLPDLAAALGAPHVLLVHRPGLAASRTLIALHAWLHTPSESPPSVVPLSLDVWPSDVAHVLQTGQPQRAEALAVSGHPIPGPWLVLPLMHAGQTVGVLGLVTRPAAPEGIDHTLERALAPLGALLGGILGTHELTLARQAATQAQTRAQNHLMQNHADYQHLFEVAGVGLARVSPTGELLDVNQRFADICGRDRHLMVGLDTHDFTHPDDRSAAQAIREATLAGHQDRYTLEKRYLRPHGDAIWVQVTAVLVRNSQGQPQHFVSVVEDISQRRQYQEAILSAQTAERASKAKTEFLSRMSHELRTPLNAMLGFAQLLRVDPRHPLLDSQRQKVRYIEQAGAHLLGMLTDVLDLSRIEAGSLPLTLEPLQVRSVLAEAMALVHHQAQEQQLNLRCAQVAETAFVCADALRLRQVLVNLLSNAIKYNRPQGQVNLDVQVLEPEVIFSVHDTGRGLSAEQQAHLFEPFNRLGAERTGIEGTGIGLVIVRRLVTLMSGRVEVSSLEGQGSVFRVILPWSAPPQPDDSDVVPSGYGELNRMTDEPRMLRLLYAEDNIVNIELVRQVMRMRPDWHFEVAMSGTEAIQMALSHPPDLLLLDMHLGDMSGLDVADELALHPHTMGLRKAGLSADVMPDQLRAARERGFVTYLTKPLDVGKLLRLLDSFAPTGGSGTSEGQVREEPSAVVEQRQST